MTLSLGEALTANNDSAFEIDDREFLKGIEKAREELRKDPKAAVRKEPDRKTLDGALKKAMFTALDVAIDDILGQAWSGWTELREYADPEKTPPEDVHVVSVSNHTIESVHEPAVDVVVNGITVHSFPFHVAAQLDVEGVNLVVQGGMIQEIQMGSLKLGGSVKLRDRTLLQKDLAQVTIPGVIQLAKPIPIH